MIAVDTNVLIYAHRKELPLHQEAFDWLRSLAEGDSLWGVPVFCLGEFVRVVTHVRIFHPPSSLDEAIEALSGLQNSPSIRILSPGDRFSGIYFDLLKRGDARGNLAFDAQIAAVCLEHGFKDFLTADRDFSRFPTLVLRAVSDPPS